MNIFDRFTGRVADFVDDVLLPDDLRVLMLRARRALEAGESDRALELLGAIESRKPNNARVRALTGLALYRQGRHEEAARRLKEAAELRPEPETWLYLGLALEGAGEARGARDALREGLRASPSPETALQVAEALGRVYLSLGRGDKAVHELRKAIRGAEEEQEAVEGDRMASARSTLARALLERGEVGEARCHLEAVLAEPGRDEAVEAAASELYGRVLLELGQAAEAAEVLEALHARQPARLATRLLSARAALEAGRPQVVQERLSEALGELEGADKVEALLLLGRAHLRAGAPERALEVLEVVLSQEREHAEGLLAAGRAALALAERSEDGAERVQALERAEGYLSRLRRLAPERVEGLIGLGEVRLGMGDWSRARQLLSQAWERGEPSVLLDLSEACLRSGDAPAAVVYLSRLLALGPAAAVEEQARELLARAQRTMTPQLALAPGDRADARQVRRVAEALRAWAARTPQLVSFLPELSGIVEAMEAPLSIAVLGEFNAGKSTLVNLLVGEPVVPTGVLPTTAHINVMRFGTRRAAELHMVDGEVEEVAFPDVKRRVKRDEGERRIDHIEYLYPHPDLRRVHIWDTPGFNALDDGHDAHALEALTRAEAILWVTDATQPISDSEKERLDAIAEPADRVVVVLNKVDRFGEGQERQDACEELEAHVAASLEVVHGIFSISASEGLEAVQIEDEGDRDEALSRSGARALLSFVEAEVYDRAGRLKATDGARALAEVVERIDAHGLELASGYEEALGELEAIRAEIEAAHARFLKEEVRQERLLLADQVDFLLVVISREIVEALRPASGLMGSLLTRVELDEEDVEFIIELLSGRYAQLLSRSRARVGGALYGIEQQLSDRVHQLARQLGARDGQAALRRMQAHAAEGRALRMLLTDRVYERYRLLAQGRLSGPGASRLVRTQAARREASDVERQGALRRLLPDAAAAIEEDLTAWAREYFDAALSFCDLVEGDLQVMAAVARALSITIDGLEPAAPPSKT